MRLHYAHKAGFEHGHDSMLDKTVLFVSPWTTDRRRHYGSWLRGDIPLGRRADEQFSPRALERDIGKVCLCVPL